MLLPKCADPGCGTASASVYSEFLLLPPTSAVPIALNAFHFRNSNCKSYSSIMNPSPVSFKMNIYLYYPNQEMLGFTPSQLLKEQHQNNIF